MCEKCQGRGVIYAPYKQIGAQIIPCDEECRREAESRYQTWRKKFYKRIGKPMPEIS
jgi:flagellar biosynthesis component FlhA